MSILVAKRHNHSSRRLVIIAGAALLVTLIIGTTNQDAVKLGAGLFLYGLAPGLLLTGWLFPQQNVLERLVLSVGSSFALSTLTLLIVTLVWGPLTLAKVLLSLAVLFCVLIVAPFLFGDHTEIATSVPRSVWLSFLLVILMAGMLRLPGLGDAEFQDDEIDVGNAVQQVIRDDAATLFQDRRGPAQTLITSAFYLITGHSQEWLWRAPVALTNLAAIAALFVLAWSLFNWQIALVSGLLLSLDGFVLAYGRVVQMQSTLLLMMVLSTLCLYLAYKSQKPTISGRYVGLGVLFFAFGLLAHYEMLLMAPVLAYLYFARYGRAFWRNNNRIGLLLIAAILVLVVGGFYAPFVFNPAFRATYDYYNQEIIGRGIRDNLHEFLLVGTVYHSIYYFSAIWLLLGVTWTVQLGMMFRSRLWSRWLALGLGVSAFTILSADLLGFWSKPWLSLTACVGVAVLCIGPKRTSIEMRVLFLWFFGFFTLYSFRLRELHVHYYVYSLPWAVLAAVGLVWLHRRASTWLARFNPYWTTGYFFIIALGGELFLALCIGYLWLVFLKPSPEYALTYPQFKNPIYATLYDQRQGEAFGFPHQSGWKTIGYLYRTGALRGSYETNELYLTAEWYTRHFIRDDQPPRYYFVATVPHRLQASPWPPPFDSSAYHWIGAVMVMGQPRLQMYERNAFLSVGPAKIYPAEAYDPLYDSLVTVQEVQREARFQADDQFFRAVAHHLESVAQPHDGLLLNVPAQAGILSYYYHGDMPYYLLAEDASLDNLARAKLVNTIIAQQHPHLYALFWGEQTQDPTGQFEIWLNQQLFKLDEQWFGNLRLVRYDIPEKVPGNTMQHELPMALGEPIRFLGYTVTQKDNLHLSLFWQAVKPIDKRYKVFVHLLDPAGKLVSQNDSEPGGGRYPTDRWAVADARRVADSVILDNYALALPADRAKGDLRLEIGMYNPATGERLPIFDAQQRRQPNDAILVKLVGP